MPHGGFVARRYGSVLNLPQERDADDVLSSYLREESRSAPPIRFRGIHLILSYLIIEELV